VTTAIGSLVERGLVRRLAGGGLLLCGEPSPDVVERAVTDDAVDAPRSPRAAPPR
jgi:hypothetical protein